MAVLGAACGTAGGSADAGSGVASADEERQDALLAFAECMREHGVDMPDPEVGEDGVVMIGPGPGGQEVDPETMREAHDACRDELPAMEEPTAEEQAEMEDAMLEFAECMRDHGVDMPDPGEGGGFIRSGDGGEVRAAFDFDDPDFVEAQEACSHLMPGRLGRSGEGS